MIIHEIINTGRLNFSSLEIKTLPLKFINYEQFKENDLIYPIYKNLSFTFSDDRKNNLTDCFLIYVIQDNGKYFLKIHNTVPSSTAIYFYCIIRAENIPSGTQN